MRSAGCGVWAWRADETDAILALDAEAARHARLACELSGSRAQITDHVPEGFIPEPWGWSLYTRQRLLDAGADAHLMPDDNMLQTIRMLSHRRTSIAMHRELGTDPCLMPVEATTLADALKAIDRFGSAVLKLPWSCSGRGVLFSEMIPHDTLTGYISGIIHRQGSVIVEPHYTGKVCDFALLFDVSPTSGARYLGASTFLTDGRGNYAGNVVASQSRIAGMIGLDPTALAVKTAAALERTLEGTGYSGPAGVDMLLWRSDDDATHVVPCIEINFRTTMGNIALDMARQTPECVMSVNPATGITKIKLRE